MSLKFNKIEPISDINKLLCSKLISVLQPEYIENDEEKIVLPEYYLSIANEIENFEVRNSDIFVISYPKTGTTWMQEMLWQILNNVTENIEPILLKVPFLEIKCIYDYRNVSKTYPDFVPPTVIADSVNYAKNSMANPRLLKTHLPWSLLPKQIRNGSKKPKIIYTTRNPKDTCVSYYHHMNIHNDFDGNLNDFCRLFLENKVIYGSYSNHISSFVNQKSKANILFTTYEDMKTDLDGVINKICKFLDKQLTNTQINTLQEVLKFENMKKNYVSTSNVNARFFKHNRSGSFMRKGILGSYKDEMSLDMMEKFDEWAVKEIQDKNLSDYVKCNI